MNLVREKKERERERKRFHSPVFQVLDETVEFTKSGERNDVGMVVIRGNSVVMIDAKDRI